MKMAAHRTQAEEEAAAAVASDESKTRDRNEKKKQTFQLVELVHANF